MRFGSDNLHGVAPELLTALEASSKGFHGAYETDGFAQAIEASLSSIFEREVKVFIVATGTAANCLGLSVLIGPYDVVFCHGESHLFVDECAGLEAMSGGARLLGLPGAMGKIDAERLAREIRRFDPRHVHSPQRGAVTVSLPSEFGTLYRRDELEKIGEVAREAQIGFHMDGARFANAVVASGQTPSALTWRCGVDVLTFGVTKNGGLMGEVVVFFDPQKARDFAFRRKRFGHLLSKSWVAGAQLQAYFENDLWRKLAETANRANATLAQALRERDMGLVWPPEVNVSFVLMPRALFAHLRQMGLMAYEWTTYSLQPNAPIVPDDLCVVRLFCGFSTTDQHIGELIEAVDAYQGPVATIGEAERLWQQIDAAL